MLNYIPVTINQLYVLIDSFHKGICSKRTFARLGTFIYWQLKRWAKYQLGNKNRWCLFAGR
jgi:hypothetical protein